MSANDPKRTNARLAIDAKARRKGVSLPLGGLSPANAAAVLWYISMMWKVAATTNYPDNSRS